MRWRRARTWLDLDTNVHRSLTALLIVFILIGLILVGAGSPTDGVPPSPSVLFATNTTVSTLTPNPSPSGRGEETNTATEGIIATWTKTRDPELTESTSTISPFTATSSITLTSPSALTATATPTSTASASPATLSASASDLPKVTLNPTDGATPTGERFDLTPSPSPIGEGSETPSQPPPNTGEESSTPMATATPTPTPTVAAATTTSTPAAINSPTATTSPTEVALPSFAVPDEATLRWCLQLDMPRECLVVNDLIVRQRTPAYLPPDLHLKCLDNVEIRNHPDNVYSAFEFLYTSTAWVEGCTFARLDNTVLSCCADALAITYSAHITIRNVTAVYGVDSSCDVIGSNDVRFEATICADGLHHSTHLKGAHSMAFLSYQSSNVEMCNVLLANSNERLPRVVSSQVNFQYLTVFNPGTQYGGRVSSEYGPSRVNFANVTFIPGLDSKPDSNFVSLDETAYGGQVWIDNRSLVRASNRDKLSNVPLGTLPDCTPLPLEALGARGNVTDELIACIHRRDCRIIDSPPG